MSVTEEDEVVMAYLKGKNNPMPMVKNRQGEPCSCMTVMIRKEKGMENHYTLVNAYIGQRAVMGSWDKKLTPGSKEMNESIQFWERHALIFDEQLVERLA